MAQLKEERMTGALKRLAESATRRERAQHLLEEVEREHRRNLLAALKAGVTTRRAAEVGQLSPDTVNRWSREAKAAETAKAAKKEAEG
jgi:hypothetical protein